MPNSKEFRLVVYLAKSFAMAVHTLRDVFNHFSQEFSLGFLHLQRFLLSICFGDFSFGNFPLDSFRIRTGIAPGIHPGVPVEEFLIEFLQKFLMDHS